MSASATAVLIGAAPGEVHAIEHVARPGAEWDAFVRARPESTFCHLAGWHGVLSETLGSEPHYLAARDRGGAITGVLPLARVRSILGDYLVSLPFLNYGGALGDERVRTELAEAAAALGEKLRVGTIELRSRTRETSRFRPTDRKITVELSLPASSGELWERLRSKLRSQIRRPMKEGMVTRVGADQADAFYSVFARNMRDLGTPVLPRRFFRALTQAFPAEATFLAVYHDERPVAGGCGFFHGDEFEMTWASSLREYNHASPNMLLYWDAMRTAIDRGARRFNFGRCTPGGGTHRFKLQWGSHDVPLGWSSWPPQQGDALPSADKPIFRLATGVWQRLPLWTTDRLGPILARWLP